MRLEKKSVKEENIISIFMCGDVMTGRGIDRILPHPSNSILYEPYMKDAIGYVELAEDINGQIQKPVNFSYIWGDALKELERVAPDLRIINLETSVTKNEDYWIGKQIHYRMNPENIACLTAAKIDFCSLANNHVLDWGYLGLSETIETLKKVNIKTAGAGRNSTEAEIPALIEIEGKGRVLAFSFGTKTSGIPSIWSAASDKPGVNFLLDLSNQTVLKIKEKIQKIKQKKDIVIVSIHWGSNWGYDIPRVHIEFAHKLIDRAGVDIIHGHSSHHVKGIEVYKGKLIIYGCGDLINDYEGIRGYETYRGDLGLMYFANIDLVTGKLVHLRMNPTQIKQFRLNLASESDIFWLRNVLNREGKRFGSIVEFNHDNTLTLKYN